jgi:hypothetical protein
MKKSFSPKTIGLGLLLWTASLASVDAQGSYPNFAPTNLQFNTSADVGGFPGSGGQWWSQAGAVAYQWVNDDSKGNPNSGSLLVGGAWNPSENDFFFAIPFDPTWTYNSTNGFIDATRYTAVEYDVKWDAADSTVTLLSFNATGDISGFPLGLMYDSNGTQVVEACGAAGPLIPTSASSGWVHLKSTINRATPGLNRTTGLWFKKYNSGKGVGNAYFYLDNVVFDGGPLPPAPTLSVSQPVPGLQINFTGASASPPNDRENIVTGPSGTGYSFVNAPSSVTYTVTYGYFPPSSNAVSGVITIVPTSSPSGAAPNTLVTGTETEPDFTDGVVLQMSMARYTGTNKAFAGGSQVVLQYKGNNATNSAGTLNDARNSNTTWTVASPIEGAWAFTITGNTSIAVVAPNGLSTNLTFPLGLTPSQVSAQMAGGAYVYFGGRNGASGTGQRIVITHASITESFLAPGKWNIATDDATRTDGVYLLGGDTKAFLDWTTNGGAGWQIMTNNSPTRAGFGIDPDLTAKTVLNGARYHTEISATNLPGNGASFFKLSLTP